MAYFDHSALSALSRFMAFTPSHDVFLQALSSHEPIVAAASSSASDHADSALELCIQEAHTGASSAAHSKVDTYHDDALSVAHCRDPGEESEDSQGQYPRVSWQFGDTTANALQTLPGPGSSFTATGSLPTTFPAPEGLECIPEGMSEADGAIAVTIAAVIGSTGGDCVSLGPLPTEPPTDAWSVAQGRLSCDNSEGWPMMLPTTSDQNPPQQQQTLPNAARGSVSAHAPGPMTQQKEYTSSDPATPASK